MRDSSAGFWLKIATLHGPWLPGAFSFALFTLESRLAAGLPTESVGRLVDVLVGWLVGEFVGVFTLVAGKAANALAPFAAVGLFAVISMQLAIFCG